MPRPGRASPCRAQPALARSRRSQPGPGAETGQHKQVDWCPGDGAGAGTVNSLPGQIEPPSQNKQRLYEILYDISNQTQKQTENCNHDNTSAQLSAQKITFPQKCQIARYTFCRYKSSEQHGLKRQFVRAHKGKLIYLFDASSK